MQIDDKDIATAVKLIEEHGKQKVAIANLTAENQNLQAANSQLMAENILLKDEITKATALLNEIFKVFSEQKKSLQGVDNKTVYDNSIAGESIFADASMTADRGLGK